jgi:hypothetical protein
MYSASISALLAPLRHLIVRQVLKLDVHHKADGLGVGLGSAGDPPRPLVDDEDNGQSPPEGDLCLVLQSIVVYSDIR